MTEIIFYSLNILFNKNLYLGGFIMNEQILIGILTEMKEMKTEMKEMKTEMKEMKTEMKDMKTEMKEMKTEMQEMNGRITNLENDMTEVKDRVKLLEKSRKEDVRAINDILYSFEQGMVRMIDERIENKLY